MSFTKALKLTWIILSLFLLSCSEGVQTGSLLKDFGGIEEVEILSPTAVKIRWNGHSRYKNYLVYANTSSNPLYEVQFTEVIVRDLIPNTSYTFKVVATDGSKAVGGDREITVRTPERFAGIDLAARDAEGNIIIQWNYAHEVEEFLVYYDKYKNPTASSTGNWETFQMSTRETRNVLRNLEGSTRYHFIVHVKYLDGTYDRPMVFKTAATNSGFPTPSYDLSRISIGALPYARVTPVGNSEYPLQNYTSRMYWNGNPISDPLTGAGTLVFSSTSNLPLGKVDGLELRVTFSRNNAEETLVIDGLETYIKGIPLNSEKLPIAALGAGDSYLGEVLTTGDFNCDGVPDLAMGLPNAVLADLGVKERNAGAVYVYYSYRPSGSTEPVLKTFPAPKRNPVVRGQDPQVITFEDLGWGAQFGASLSGQGNINGDSLAGKECQDLVVGAPYYRPSNEGRQGAAFVFFGSPTGLAAPSSIADMEVNYGTCSGETEGASCTAVMLWPDRSLIPSGIYNPGIRYNYQANESEFGFAVSHIGDFNGDGYGDIAIGSPKAHYDGVVDVSASDLSQYELYTGAAYLYMGSPNGIASETINSDRFNFLKVYAPVPQSHSRFGHSIAGGVDVDGNERIQDGSRFYGGSDMVIGSPGFAYPTYGTTANSRVKSRFRSATDTCTSPDSCGSYIPTTEGYRARTLTAANIITGWLPLNGSPGTGPGRIQLAPGAAYLYFGRGGVGGGVGQDKAAFWQCGTRNISEVAQHFSCLAGGNAGVTLTPRFGWATNITTYRTQGFGTSVAMLGSASRTTNNVDPAVWRDPNRDGFGEVAVASGYFDLQGTGARANAGAVWVFYGNPDRLYEPKVFHDNSTADRTNDWYFNEARCSTFASGASSSTQIDSCAPVLLSPNSVSAGTLLGAHNNIAVGDITGDGVHDLLVGGIGANNLRGIEAGVAYAFTSTVGSGLTTNMYEFYNQAGNQYDRFGSSVAIGNFNGDTQAGAPVNDVFIGASLDDSHKNGGGALYGFYSNNGAGFPATNSTPSVKIVDDIASPQLLGYGTFRLVGDINGDGYEDAVGKISSPSANGLAYTSQAIVYYGSAVGLVTTSFCLENKDKIFRPNMGSDADCYPSQNPMLGLTQDDIMLPHLINRPTGVSVGWALHGYDVGDVNGDGFSDVGFLDWTSGSGQFVVYYGSRGGLQTSSNPSWSPAAGDPQLVAQTYVRIGDYINDENPDTEDGPDYRKHIIHGDFNGDGYSDIVFAEPLARAFWSVNVTGGVPLDTTPDGITVPAGSGWYCGTVITSAYCEAGMNAGGMGRVYIFYGSNRGAQSPRLNGALSEPAVNPDLSSTDENYLVDTYSSENVPSKRACNTATGLCKTQYLYSPLVANVDSGYYRMRHRFGSSVTVMDVDHDGIDDLVVGAPGWEDIACYIDMDPMENYGRVFIYKGSQDGILAHDRESHYNANYVAGSCSSSDGFVLNDASLNLSGSSTVRALMPSLPYDTTQIGMVENRAARAFGFEVTAAGDINGDGYEDLVVSAPRQTPLSSTIAQAGVLYVYYGPLCGSDNSPSVWGNQLTEYNTFHQFSDPIISVSPIAECDRGASGAKPAPMPFYLRDTASTGDRAGLTLVGNRKGKSDFNGDGFDDVLVGVPYYDDKLNMVNDVGRGVVFFGNSQGLNATDYPDTSVVSDPNGKVKPYIIYQGTDQFDVRYFFSGTSGADINNDGTIDYMIPSQTHDGYAPLKGVDVGTFYLIY